MNKKGRPQAKIDWEKLDMVLELGASLDMTAGYLDVSEDTIEKYIRKEKGYGFREYRERKMAKVKLKLIQKAQTMASDGNVVMLIFCLKNLAGWTDKVEHGFDKDKRTILLKYNLDESKELTPPDADLEDK
jgi:hypothetical protein